MFDFVPNFFTVCITVLSGTHLNYIEEAGTMFWWIPITILINTLFYYVKVFIMR